MFRSPKPGDWAADDEDTLPVPAAIPPPDNAAAASEAEAVAPPAAPVQDARGDARSHSGGRFDRDRNNTDGRGQRNTGRFDRDKAPHGRLDQDRGSDRDGARSERDRKDPAERLDRDRTNGHEGGRFERDRNHHADGRYDRDRDSDRDGGRFDRDRHSGRDGGRFDRDRPSGRDGGRFDRDRHSGREEENSDRNRNSGREGDRYERGEGRADAGRWGHHADRRGDARGGGRDLPVEQGFVVSIKESFGFVSCLERDGDLFFHISEAPVDVQLHDEVEFRVKYNQRSDKEMACQLVALPKGSIKVEEIGSDLLDGVVTKSLPRGGHGNNRGTHTGDRHYNREEYGLIAIKMASEREGAKEMDAKEAAIEEVESSETADKKANVKEAAIEEGESSETADKKPLIRREFVRFSSDSVAGSSVKWGEKDQEQSDENKKGINLYSGDEVRFRIAKHRKTGAKRAVDITVVMSARDKVEKDIEAKLATMTREFGIVSRVKNGGGFIKCCDRPVDVHFHFREILEVAQSEADTKNGEHDDGQAEPGDKPQRGQPGKGSAVREGDEVSFFVYEDSVDDSTRSQPRLTAVRVQKLPSGTVSFEKLLQTDLRGLVSTPPKEPRSGHEVIGKIAVIPAKLSDTGSSKEAADTANDSVPESDEKVGTRKKGKDKKSVDRTVAFRLRDIEDVSYVPRTDDEVVFDEVLDKRTGKVKAAKVRVVRLNHKNRETGIVNAMKEDFGFIKCAERSGDAYFRFSDVIGTNRSFGNGTEVAFDVDVDSKSDHIRATRLQILPRGSVKWEDVVGEGIEGVVAAVPSSRNGHASNRGGRGDKMKRMQKFVPGKIKFVTPQKQHAIDFLPDLKEKLVAACVTSEDVVEEVQEEEGDEKKSEEAEDSAETLVLFPSTLSRFERAALHDYSVWLGLKTRSKGGGSHSQFEIFGKRKIAMKAVEEKLATSAPELTAEFKEDDVVDVRYNPKVGDRVRFDLAVVKRTKELRCTSVSCLEAAVVSKPKVASVKKEANTGEGYIMSVKPEGFGFIQPAQSGLGSPEENLFFHIKDITTGQTLADLKAGTEVQFTIFVDEKKDKKRATSVSIVPAGTIKVEVPKSVKGVVSKASFLQRMKGGAKGRFPKANNKASSLGRIRLVTAEDGAEDSVCANGNTDDEAEEDEEAVQQATNGDAKTGEQSTSGVTKKAEKKKLDKQIYLYNIRDIVDPSVVLREGDEVEFTPQMQHKNLRAAHVRLIVSHAKQGVVTRITEDLGGVICLDGEEPAVEARFTARGVLGGDTLREGDRVEFAYRPPSASPVKNEISKSEMEEDKEEQNETGSTKENEETNDESTNIVLGQALSVLRLSSSPNAAVASPRRGSRMVNSTLKEAMRQAGANAMVASRMAKGPNGTRGFAETWNPDAAETLEVVPEKPSVELPTASATAACTTEQSQA